MSFNRFDPQAAAARRAAQRQANLDALCQPTNSLHRGTYEGSAKKPEKPLPPKFTLSLKVNNKVRESARGEECLVRIPGICTGDPETTIWSHARFEAAGKGKSTKALDLCGAYCCTACDAVFDGQRPRPPGYSQWDIDRLWMFGHFRSLVRLAEKGLV